MICILEDNADRIARFRKVAARIAPAVEVRIWPNAHEMIRELPAVLATTVLISLDHDLNPRPGNPADPGTGYDVVKRLIELEPTCPIILHTSNAERRTWMVGELSRTKWRFEHVYPFEDDWIETDWARTVRALLAPQA